jgi:hydrogenase maturation protease
MTMHRLSNTKRPRRTLLLACGNTFRGDDGVGWRIGCAVEQQFETNGLTVLWTRELLPEHAGAISAADIVVFVDCSAVTAAGTVSTVPLKPAETLPRSLSHHLDPASLLKLSLDLYSRVPTRAVAVAIGGESFELTDQLSRSVKAAVPKALEAIRTALLNTGSVRVKSRQAIPV